MLEIKITDIQVEKAKNKANRLGLLTNSIRSGEGNIIGFLGEQIVIDKFGLSEDENSYDYDLVTPKGKRIEVKSKECTSAPFPYYECSVCAANCEQACDYYMFVRVHCSLKWGWILGIIKRQDFFTKSRFLKKGKQDGDNGYVVKKDCYNIRIDELKQLK